MVELICKILKIGKATYYRYKKSNEPVLSLLKYFDKDELMELKINYKIKRLELIKNIDIVTLEKIVAEYELRRINNVNDETDIIDLGELHQEKYADIYDVLADLKKDIKELKEK